MLRVFAALAVVLLLVVGWFGYDAWRSLNSPLQAPAASADPQPDSASQTFELVVKPGDTLTTIAADLRRRDLLKKPHWLKLYARATGEARKIRSGEFSLATTLTPIQLLGQLQAGREKQHSFTIIEGWTIWQLRQALAEDSVIKSTIDPALADDQIMSLFGPADLHPEGQFLPDTYLFPRGTTDVDFLARAHEALKAVLQEAWDKRQSDLPLKNSYEALILASIVERETGISAERAKVAGVMANRLRKRMRLQTDPTVIYGIGPSFNGDITRKDLKTATPYNTYIIKALPPTPIAMSGQLAIEAALNPASTTALFFVADGSGGHVFSDTIEQHNVAVRKYILKK